MAKIRVLVVDDAVVMRRLISEAIGREPTMEVVGTAPNGRVCLQRIGQVNPDVVTLDLEMPEMDGLETLREIRRLYPKLPVIMLSSLTRRGGEATLDALAAGASDYITKPSESANLEETIAKLGSELHPRLRAHAPLGLRAPEPAPSGVRALLGHNRPLIRKNFDLLCIATSTGGPNALADVFRGLRAAPNVPVAIVQHMPPMFTKLLAERLSAVGGPLSCVEAEDGQVLLPGAAYLAPGGRHLALTREASGRFIARLLDTPPENSCRPAADVLLRSAAECGASALTVVMTGMGQDGLRGAQRLLEVGGELIVQDEASSVVWGMPGAIVQAGLPATVKPLLEIAAEISRRLPAKA